MNAYIDYAGRIKKIQAEMKKSNLDLFVGTRTVSLSYVAGAFIPWRSAVIVSKDGDAGLISMLLDCERLKNESWLSNISPYAPLPGMDLMDLIIHSIKQHGAEKGRIGVELGHSPRGNTGYLFATEYELLKNALPQAAFVNAINIVDRACYIKEPGEIKLLRQTAAIADAAMDCVKASLDIGMTEAQIAGIGEMELRRLGSEYHWAVTGSSEVASGYRATYAMNGTTQPTQKILQSGENLIVDLHPLYQLYPSDLAHNFIIGKPSPEQQKLADAYLATAETIVRNFKAGNKVGDVCKAVMDKLTELGYAQYTIPSFGHGLGVFGHEWYPAIVNNDEFRDVVLEENVVEVAFLAMTVPGVCGMRLECPVLVTKNGGEMLCKTPLDLTVLD
ncbi:MAG TPA: Xaa-Pro peptidase family protein [Smithella sp.]|nr:aminopeptidase P family protein [Smithella sp.]MDM7988154.1 Xaa-Pro peptidase family protein [Smithella sp.]HNY51508.1 Xaa-Pro peptidase family protein [Smithella sp.]HOG90676.1 Xaa-Pro peptidase family protein [Smithella sp.]HOU51602.1 Xaa-Pro peptidase family protein [Smithella sp.]